MAGIRHHLVGLIISLCGMVIVACSSFVKPPATYCVQVKDVHPARIAILGDLQRTGLIEVWRERNDEGRARLVRQLASEAPTAVVLLGDMVWWGSSLEEWSYFDHVMRPIQRRDIPVLPILGNHEYYGDDDDAMANVRVRFPIIADEHYVRVIDSVALVMINTNFAEMTEQRAREERAWYLRTLRALDRDPAVVHVVVCGHHPPFTNSTVVTDDKILRRAFIPPFLAASKTALWLSGHAHAYERFEHGGKHFIVSGGGGGPRQELRTAANGARHLDQYDGPKHRPMHYLIIERRRTELYCTMRPLDASNEDAPKYDVVVIPAGRRQHTNSE